MPWGVNTSSNFGFPSDASGFNPYPGSQTSAWNASGFTAAGSFQLNATFTGASELRSIYPTATPNRAAAAISNGAYFRASMRVSTTASTAGTMLVSAQVRVVNSAGAYLGSLGIQSVNATTGGGWFRLEGYVSIATVLATYPTAAYVDTEAYIGNQAGGTAGSATILFDEISGQFGDPSQPTVPLEFVRGNDEWQTNIRNQRPGSTAYWQATTGTVTVSDVTAFTPQPGVTSGIRFAGNSSAWWATPGGGYGGSGAAPATLYSEGKHAVRPGDIYKPRVWVRNTGTADGAFTFWLRVYLWKPDGTWHSDNGVSTFTMPPTGNNTLVTGYFTVPAGAAYASFAIRGENATANPFDITLIAPVDGIPGTALQITDLNNYFDAATNGGRAISGSGSGKSTNTRSSFIGTRPVNPEKAGAADEHSQVIADPESLLGTNWGGYQPSTTLTQSNVAASIPGTPITGARRYTGTASDPYYLATAQVGDPATGVKDNPTLISHGYRPVVAGQLYTFSYWIRADHTGVRAGTRSYFRNSSGSFVTALASTNDFLSVGDWRLITSTFTVPAGAAWAMSWMSVLHTTGQAVDFRITGAVDSAGPSTPAFYLGSGYRASRLLSIGRSISASASSAVDVASRQVNRFRSFRDSLFADDGRINLNFNPLPINSSYYSVSGVGQIVQAGYDPSSPVNQYSIEHRPTATGVTDSFISATHSDWKVMFGTGDYVDVGCYVWANSDAFSQFGASLRSGAIVAFPKGGTTSYTEYRSSRNTVANTWQFVTLRIPTALTGPGSNSDEFLLRFYNLQSNTGGDPRVKHAGITIRRANAGDPAMTASDLVYPSMVGHAFHGANNGSRNSVSLTTILKNRVRSFVENANGSRNIAANGGGESGTFGWGGSGTVSVDTTVYRTGAQSIKFVQPAAAQPVIYGTPGPAGTYSAIAYVIVDEGVVFSLNGTDVFGNVYTNQNFVGTGTWQAITTPNFYSINGSPGVKIRINGSGGTMWIDEVQILTSMDTSARVFRPSRNIVDLAPAADAANPISALMTWVRNLNPRELTSEFITSIGTRIKLGRSGMVPLADVEKYKFRYYFVNGDAKPKVLENKAPNPSGDVDVGLWTGGNMYVSRTTSNQKSGEGGFVFTSISAINHNIRHVNNRSPVEAGKMYWGAAEFMTDGPTDGRVGRVYLDFYDAASVRIQNFVGAATAPLTYPEWTRATVVAQAPIGSVTAQIIVEVLSPTTGVYVTYVDEIIWDEGNEVREFQDGSSNGWVFAGAPNTSTSYASYHTWVGNVREGDKTDNIWVDGIQRRLGESFPVRPATLVELKELRVMQEGVYPTTPGTATIYV